MELRGTLADHFSTSSPNLFRHSSERRTDAFKPAWQKSRPCPLSRFSTPLFTSLSEENFVPYKCSINFGKRKQSLGHREAIRRKRPAMLRDGVILLHDNTHTGRKNARIAAKVQVGSLEPP
ncbi:hypothetical protein AVEN_88984-1 [Araneus ventricosus]|uniref:Uncharacterized protein n=1 Tax=Araneus ventricosus TaxID=182803 RepID=A0A4Y2DKE4_ARAVE|nr:hypothetical protein AVEN_88984-1 [Araneus ventricosus]